MRISDVNYTDFLLQNNYNSHQQVFLSRINNSKPHNPGCQKQPSNCSCVEWIWASSSIQVKSVRRGMWTLCHEKHFIDDIWEKIKTLLSENQLGNQARVSTNKKMNENKHFICLYTYDFDDVQDVFRVLLTMQRNHLDEDYAYMAEETYTMMYFSPPMRNGPETEFTESILLFKHKIEPESEIGLVAELKKTKFSEDVIKFYNPPKIQPSYSSQSSPCKYNKLFDHESDFHEPDCDKQPSTCDCENVSWIWVSKPLQVESIHSGKWLLFPEKKNVDEVWEKVKILIAANRLGEQAKVSKGEKQDEHVVCVYTTDFENVQDVFRVLVTLRRNHLQDSFINYKTDEATLEGVYKTDEAAQRAGYGSTKKLEPGRRVSMYFSPPSPIEPTGATEVIKLFLNNIGPEFKRGLVAELRKESRDMEAKIIFYNPPKILNPPKRSPGFYPKCF